MENAFDDADRPVRVRKLTMTPDRIRILAENNGQTVSETRLCTDSKGRYVYDCESSANKKTPFFAYVKIEPVTATNPASGTMTVSGAFAVSAYFVSTDSGFRSYDMHTVITDWKR